MNNVKASVIALSAMLAGCHATANYASYPAQLPLIPPPPTVSTASPAQKQEQEAPSANVEEPQLEIKVSTEDSKSSYFDTLTAEYKALIKTIAWAEYTTPPCIGDISPYQILAIGEVVDDPQKRYGGRFGNWNPSPKKDEDTCRGQYFIGYDDHPRIPVKWHPRARATTAAGMQQWMEETFDHYGNLKTCGPAKDEDCGLFPDFSPDSQTKATMFVIKVEKGITQEKLEEAVKDGNFSHIWKAEERGLDFFPIWKPLSPVWASLPFYNWQGHGVSRYHKRQNARSFQALKSTYMGLHQKYQDEERLANK